VAQAIRHAGGRKNENDLPAYDSPDFAVGFGFGSAIRKIQEIKKPQVEKHP